MGSAPSKPKAWQPQLVPVTLKGNKYDPEATTFYRGVRADWILEFLARFPDDTTLDTLHEMDLYAEVPPEAKGPPECVLLYPEFLADRFTCRGIKTLLMEHHETETLVWSRFVSGVQNQYNDHDDVFLVNDYWSLPKSALTATKGALL